MPTPINGVAHEQEKPAKFCPFCGGTKLYLGVQEVLNGKDIPVDPQSGQMLDENQCADECCGRSFWV